MANNRTQMEPNAMQGQVIDELERNILLLASAGTGKTGTIAQRVANIIKGERAQASEILCLTFTNKASKELKSSISQIVGALGSAVKTGTFHGFCFQILQEEGKATDTFYQEMTVFDEEESGQAFLDMWNRRREEPLSEGALSSMVSFVRVLKEYRALSNFFSGDDEVDFAKTIEAMKKDKSTSEYIRKIFTYKGNFLLGYFTVAMTEGAPLVAAYNRELRDNRAVDFTDIIVGVYELFQKEPIRNRWNSRFRYIAIDEVQDTSQLEFEVLRHLWPGNNVLLSGDFFQTIYEWRGSEPRRILEAFKKTYNPRIVTFYDNYRATKLLLEASVGTLKSIAGSTFEEFYKEIPRACSDKVGEPIEIHQVKTLRDEAQVIYRTIKNLPGTSCVLVRNNRYAEDLSRELEYLSAQDRKPLSFMLIDQFNFYRRQEIKDAFAFLKFVANPFDRQSAKRIIKHFIPGVGKGKLDELESEACRKSGLRLTDFLLLKNYEKDPFEDLIEGLDGEQVVVFDVESTGTDTTNDEIIQMAAIRIDRKGQVIERFERFIKPTKSVGDSEAVHGFSDDFLTAHGEEATTVFEAFRTFAENSVIVGHNVTYDMSILGSELDRHSLAPLAVKEVYDTLDIFRRFYPNLTCHKLGYLSEFFETNHKPSHDAMDDILATAEILVHAVEKDILPAMDQRRYFLRQKDLFATMASKMATLQDHSYRDKPKDLLAYIMNNMSLGDRYKKAGEERRLERLRELYRILEDLEEEFPAMSPRDLLHRSIQNASMTASEFHPRLMANGVIPIITVHQAKGSEFDTVCLAGMEDDVFPSYMANKYGNVSEEKRLFYVAITRPKNKLVITYRTVAYSYNRTIQCRKSPFLDYIPDRFVRHYDLI